ncbi:hypothetical protein SprV_0100454000 [Sparganum proliferum]
MDSLLSTDYWHTCMLSPLKPRLRSVNKAVFWATPEDTPDLTDAGRFGLLHMAVTAELSGQESDIILLLLLLLDDSKLKLRNLAAGDGCVHEVLRGYAHPNEELMFVNPI